MIAPRTATTKTADRPEDAGRDGRRGCWRARRGTSGPIGSHPAAFFRDRAERTATKANEIIEQHQAHRPQRLVPRLARDGVAHVQGDLAGQRGNRMCQPGRHDLPVADDHLYGQRLAGGAHHAQDHRRHEACLSGRQKTWRIVCQRVGPAPTSLSACSRGMAPTTSYEMLVMCRQDHQRQHELSCEPEKPTLKPAQLRFSRSQGTRW